MVIVRLLAAIKQKKNHQDIDPPKISKFRSTYMFLTRTMLQYNVNTE